MKWTGEELNFFAIIQKKYIDEFTKEHDSSDYVLEFSDGFDSEGNLLFYHLSVSEKQIEEFYNKLIVIVFVDERDYKNYSNIVNKTFEYFIRGKLAEKVYYAHYPLIELYKIYKNEKYNKTPVRNRFSNSLINVKIKDLTFIRERSYKDFCFAVYDELVKGLIFEKSELRLEYINYMRFELYKNAYLDLNKNLKNKKIINLSLKKNLRELENINKINNDSIEELNIEIKNKKTASQKYFDEDYKQYIDLYEQHFSWKVSFGELKKITTNPDIKNTTYNRFDTAFKNKYPLFKKRKI